jgi:hypothetical protein
VTPAREVKTSYADWKKRGKNNYSPLVRWQGRLCRYGVHQHMQEVGWDIIFSVYHNYSRVINAECENLLLEVTNVSCVKVVEQTRIANHFNETNFEQIRTIRCLMSVKIHFLEPC